MSTDIVTRPPRRSAPPLPSGDLPLEPPPAIPAPGGARWQQWLAILPMLAGTLATALMFGGRDGSGPYPYVVGGVFGVSTLGMLLLNAGGVGPRRIETMRARRDYLRYLSGVRRQVRAVIADQREALVYRHPEPDSLWGLGDRTWEHRPGDADFAVVRVGVGPQSLATELIAPVIEPSAELEPVTAGALRRFLDAYAVVPDLPVSVALRSFVRVILVAEPSTGAPGHRDLGTGDARGVARALIAQLVAFHAPGEVLVAACVSATIRREWEWLKWLPHALHPGRVDAVGPVRLVAETVAELDELLGDVVSGRGRFHPPGSGRGGEPTTPHVLVVLDGVAVEPGHAVGGVMAAGGLVGVTVLELSDNPTPSTPSTLVLGVAPDGTLTSSTVDGRQPVGQADIFGPASAEGLARRFARLRLVTSVHDQAPLAVDRDLIELLGVPDVATAPLATLWQPRPPRELLRVPIGTGPGGERIDLDLKEAAQDGMGPHGLVVGATGSGKSELLRTIVLGLACTHSSEALNVVLVDFKGGATFASLDRLPHTSAVITNLADELPLVDRMNDALSGELTRRQELLRRAGNLASIRDYDRARANGVQLPPLPALLIVCDEFTELLTAKPDFLDLFLQIGRVGRSLGVHLLLATQRLEEGRLRGLESNLSYRIALRTFTAAESRMALGVADAADLPASPGHAFLRVGTEPLRRFRAAYVSGPMPARRSAAAAPAARILPYSTAPIPVAEPAPAAADNDLGSARSLLEVVIDRLAGEGPAAHQVWLPPLSEASGIDALLAGLGRDPARGLTTLRADLRGALLVPLAVADKPYEQRRDVAWLDLSGAAGHVAIVGNPQSGKSTAVRTLVTALALTHTPTEVQVYALDFGGGSLAALRNLPHVGGVAARLDPAGVRRTVGEMATLLADRERRFHDRGIDTMATFRRLRRPPAPDAPAAGPEDGFGDVFLVVDGWATLRTEFEDLEPVLVDIATRGLSYGVHVVATATRWADFRASVKDLFGSRLELRLGDPGDSAVNRRTATNVPAGAPGRGLWPDGLHVLVAQPHAAQRSAAELGRDIAEAWPGPPAPAVRMLPSLLPYASLTHPVEGGAPAAVGTGLALPIGVAEADLRPVLLDFAAEPHLLVFGDRECGKTTLLRVLAATLTARFTPDQARIVVVDYRRGLLGSIASEHLIGYGTNLETTAPLIQSVAGYLQRRLPGADVTAAQLRDRSWWSGPECFVLVDDYDLVASGPNNPLQPLHEYLSQARDVGLHVVVTRRAGGAGRAMYEPVLQRLRELGSPGLVMAGDREEGALLGSVRPGPQPPGRGWLVTRRDGSRLVQLAHLAG